MLFAPVNDREVGGMEGQQIQPYRRVVVPLDGSAEAEAVLPAVLRLAGASGMEIMLVRVVPSPVMAADTGSRTRLDHSNRVRQEAEDYLKDVGGRWDAAGLRVTPMVRAGDPADEIVGAARDGGADIIAMSTHGRKGLGRLLFGSVAEAVIQNAGVPVLAVRLGATEAAQRAA
jgi:nucleotide-binding universal stress UspA family protein